MKLVAPLVALCLMVSLEVTTGAELVRGANLELIQSQLLHMEGHHEDLEKFEDKLSTLVTKEKPVLETESALEIGIDRSTYANNFIHPNQV